MNIQNKEIINDYLTVYNEIKTKLDKNISDDTIKIVSLFYSISNKPFQLQLFEDMSERINNEVGFSSINGELRFIISTILIIKYDYPFTKVRVLIDNIELVNDYELFTKYSLFIGFLLLDEKDVKKRLNNSKDIYFEMQERHYFITGEEDYSFSILLSESVNNTNNLMDCIEYYYKQLADDCFKRGNSLQLLSHVLTLIVRDNYKDKVINNCIQIYKCMKEEGIKVKGVIYALIGLVSTAVKEEDIDLIIKEIKEVYNYLNNIKSFKRNKEFNLIVSILVAINLKDDNKYINYCINKNKTNIDYSLLVIILSKNILRVVK
jgi:hypothetical protein